MGCAAREARAVGSSRHPGRPRPLCARRTPLSELSGISFWISPYNTIQLLEEAYGRGGSELHSSPFLLPATEPDAELELGWLTN